MQQYKRFKEHHLISLYAEQLCQSVELVWLNIMGIVVLGIVDYKLKTQGPILHPAVVAQYFPAKRCIIQIVRSIYIGSRI